MNHSHPIQSLLSMKIGQGLQVVGTPLTVFPLIWDQCPSVEAVLAASAVTAGSMQISELGGGGSVPTLQVRNQGALPVLIPQGTVLSGGQQDRVANQSVFVAAGETSNISVSCVQHGRWHGGTVFGVADTMVSVSTRYAAGSTMFDNRNSQQTVWNAVSAAHTSLGVHSQTQQFTSVFEARGRDVERFVRNLPYVDGAYGLAIGIGRKIVMVDVFPTAKCCQEMWPKLVRGAAVDALGARFLEGNPSRKRVALKLRMMTDRQWEAMPSKGLAKNWRQSFGANQSTVLTCEHDLLHLSCIRQSAI